jgi:polyhydroxybutyrate depolymerase
MRQLVVSSLIALFAVSFVQSSDLNRREWTVGEDRREALVYKPDSAKSSPAPLVFVFHGHGGTMRNAARTFALHSQWPEAIVVYPQGLPTPGQLTDPEGKRSGWQAAAGNQNDRDLKLVDRIFADLKSEVRVDESRVYATGHSNGGGFVYLLWAERGDRFAALAPSAAAGLRHLPKLKPKPVLHAAGEADALVRFPLQKRMIDQVRRVNGCEAEGKAWHDVPGATLYSSEKGKPLVTLIHPGGHKFDPNAPAAIVRFFREHPKVEASAGK